MEPQNDSKSKLLTFFDMLACSVIYGAGYNDYLIFEFYEMTREQRKTYLTRMKNKRLISAMNHPELAYVFDEKNVFDKPDYTLRIKETDSKKIVAEVSDENGLIKKTFDVFSARL